jgi:uncharacterized protein YlxW (UPF0749 family)
VKQISDNRHVDTMELQRNLTDTQTQNVALQDEVEQLRELNAQEKSRAEAAAELIADYQRQLGITRK